MDDRGQRPPVDRDARIALDEAGADASLTSCLALVRSEHVANLIDTLAPVRGPGTSGNVLVMPLAVRTRIIPAAKTRLQ
jgi:hypothetical protein